MTADIHTCSYYCERPECVRRQRDELRDRMESVLASAPPSAPVGVDWPTIVEGLREADHFFDGDDRYSPHARKVRAAYRAALAAQHQEPKP